MQVSQRTSLGCSFSPARQSVVRHASIARSRLTGTQPRLLPSQHFLSSQRAPSRTVVCQGLFGLGLPEIAVIAGIAALVFGPSKLPELGKGLGQTVKSFQTAAKEFETELKAAAKSDDEPATEEAKKEVKEVKKE